MAYKYLSILTGISLLCIGCSSSEDEPGTREEINPQPIEMTTLDKAVADKSNEFGVDFVKKNILLALERIGYDGGNIIVSPVSASIALSMAVNAVNDQQAEAIIDKLGQTDLTALNDYNAKLIDYLTTSNSVSTIKFANRMWVDDSYTVPDDFAGVMGEKYGFTPETAPIWKNWKNVAGVIDQWCDGFTEHLIPNIAPEEAPGDIFLASGLIFKNQWEKKFSSKGKNTFKGAKGDEIADMMECSINTIGFSYNGCQMVSLPYKDGRCTFTAVLPPVELSMAEFVRRMDDYGVNPLNITNATLKNYEVTLPKLSISTEVSLRKYLENEFPVFKNIDWIKAGVTRGGEHHSLKQNVSLTLDEEGTTAAVITSSDAYTANGATAFNVNRPFVFFITEKETGSIILAGVINTLSNN